MKISASHLLLLFLQHFFISTSQGQNIKTESKITSDFLEKNFLPKRSLQSSQDFSCSGSNCELVISADTEYTLTLNSGSIFIGDFFQDNSVNDLVVTYNASSSSLISAGILLAYQNSNPIAFNTPFVAHWTVVIPNYTTNSKDFQKVMLTIANNLDSPTIITFKISYSPAGDYSTTFSVTGVVLPIVLVLVAIILVSFLLHLRKKRRTRQRMQRQESTGENEKQTIIAENDLLTVENLNDRFPDAKLFNFKSSFAQTTCSICLEEFDEEKPCRQLYCEHIFHSECITLWLNNELKKGYASCPNCKTDLMKKNNSVQNLLTQASRKK